MAAQRNGQPSTGNRQLTNLRRIPVAISNRRIANIDKHRVYFRYNIQAAQSF
ncbi:MAG: hypothetical protein KDD28_03605 [Phaeodactylibacter sp.]|nr:hypothetical protein [Phaeodactylibacter sp.]